MERHSASVDAEEGHATNHFNASIVEVEHIVRCDSPWFNGLFAIEAVCYGEVGQGGDTCRWRWRS